MPQQRRPLRCLWRNETDRAARDRESRRYLYLPTNECVSITGPVSLDRNRFRTAFVQQIRERASADYVRDGGIQLRSK